MVISLTSSRAKVGQVRPLLSLRAVRFWRSDLGCKMGQTYAKYHTGKRTDSKFLGGGMSSLLRHHQEVSVQTVYESLGVVCRLSHAKMLLVEFPRFWEVLILPDVWRPGDVEQLVRLVVPRCSPQLHMGSSDRLAFY